MTRLSLALALLGILGVLVDVLVGHWSTGIVGLVAMVGLLGQLAHQALRLRGSIGSSVRRLEVALLLAAAAFAAARGHALFQDLAEAGRRYALVFLLLLGGGTLALRFASRMSRFTDVMARRPSMVLAAGFVGLIIVLGLLLSLPVSLVDPSRVLLLDGFFIMTAAVCVSGMSSVDIGTTYTLFGQVVIFVGMQLGGLGVTTVAAFALTLQRQSALDDHAHYARVMQARTLLDLRRIVRGVVVSTLVIEALGAVVLWLLWGGSWWEAVFHAVSAFVNAGFSLYPDNLMRFQGHAPTLAVIMVLVTLGGIGFPVIGELVRRLFTSRRKRAAIKLSTTTRVVLTVSALLTVFGTLAFMAFEWNQTMAAMSAGDKAMNALFHAVIVRTAGFNTIDLAAARSTTILVLMLLMFIGGSPTSAAGGIKTTTLAVLFATLAAELRGREARLFGRTIAPETLRRAVAVSTLSLATAILLMVALTLTEHQPFLVVAFEAFSAFSTAGFSAGLTPHLTEPGQLLLMIGMFVGRVGPLTVVTLVGEAAVASRHRLPPEQIPVG